MKDQHSAITSGEPPVISGPGVAGASGAGIESEQRAGAAQNAGTTKTTGAPMGTITGSTGQGGAGFFSSLLRPSQALGAHEEDEADGFGDQADLPEVARWRSAPGALVARVRGRFSAGVRRIGRPEGWSGRVGLWGGAGIGGAGLAGLVLGLLLRRRRMAARRSRGFLQRNASSLATGLPLVLGAAFLAILRMRRTQRPPAGEESTGQGGGSGGGAGSGGSCNCS